MGALAETDDLEALRAEKRELTGEEKRLRAMRDLEKVGKKAIDAAAIHKRMHEERMAATVQKRELRRQRLQMQAVEEEEKRRAAMKAQPPLGIHEPVVDATGNAPPFRTA